VPPAQAPANVVASIESRWRRRRRTRRLMLALPVVAAVGLLMVPRTPRAVQHPLPQLVRLHADVGRQERLIFAVADVLPAWARLGRTRPARRLVRHGLVGSLAGAIGAPSLATHAAAQVPATTQAADPFDPPDASTSNSFIGRPIAASMSFQFAPEVRATPGDI